MKSSLAAGLTFTFRYTVPETKTVSHVFERFVIDRERFVRKVDAKKAAALRG
jgi:hypothetical protein